MKVAIGIMLWNEEETIAPTIDSVFKQTLLSEWNPEVDGVELVVLANGCTDQSIPNAREAIDRNLAGKKLDYVSARIAELPKGRQPAWNSFVHEITADDVTYLILMDADLVLPDPAAMMRMANCLEKNPYQHIATGLGRKHFELLEHQSFWQRLTLAMTKLEQEARYFYVTGGLYCGRSEFFRQLEFPKGFICGDDGLLGYMAITNYMTTEYEWDRICYPPHPTFVFEAYLSPFRLFRQHRRRMIGAITREMILDVVKLHQSNSQSNAGQIIKKMNTENPEWLNMYISEQISKRGFWVVPFRRVLYRFRQLNRQSLAKKIIKFPIALAGASWELAVIIAANKMFHAGTYRNAWENLPNTQKLPSTNI